MAHYEKRVSGEEIFKGHVVTLTRDTVELEDGSTSFREVVHHRGGTAVLPLTEDGQVYMIRQFRYAFGRELLEIPAGKVEPNEPPLETAKRELMEECGLQADSYIDLHEIYPTTGYDTEIIYLYLARELKMGQANPDPGEFVTVEKYPLKEALDMVIRGEIHDAKTVAALLKVNYLQENGMI